ncbi:alanine racemase [uncultured Anaerococcus sp.]|uniref:alanine racemase n=1 Tax=uncultured Anaerococcus sp. TaxID=293428 RepID=UPI0025ED63F5|nr:alanine racemase [uncultured Anaerococcus sp.]
MQETFLEVNLDKIRRNIKNIKKSAGDSKFCAVVKANAYGLGSEIICKDIEYLVDYFAVARLSEALVLRRNSITKPILVLGYVGLDDIEKCYKNKIDIPIYDLELAKEINKLGYEIKGHLALDTGHGRIGFREHEINDIRKLKELDNIDIISAFSHFATADEKDPTFTFKQEKIFDKVLSEIKDDFKFDFVHLANSAASIKHKIFKSMYRVGIATYGIYPSDYIKESSEICLEKSFRLFSYVHFVKNVPANTPISYGRTFVSDKSMKVASVSIGYADGYNRDFSNKGLVYIHGKACRVLGRVCMDQMMVDVTGLDVGIGDLVEIYKDIYEDADKVGTIPYELMTSISMRVKRKYIKNNQVTACCDYLGEMYEN